MRTVKRWRAGDVTYHGFRSECQPSPKVKGRSVGRGIAS